MSISDGTDRRWWFIAAALVVLLTLVLAAGGIVMAVQQGRAVRQARIRGLRDRAEIVSTQLQNELNRLASRHLGEIYRAFQRQDDVALNRLASADAWIELAFVYDKWVLMTWPAITVARSERSHEAFAPPGFGLGEQLEFVDHNLDEAIKLYQRCTSEATPLYWQLRAHMAIAGCRSKQGRFDEAIQIYERLRTRYAAVLRSLDSPSLFSVNLALVDVLAAADERARAGEAAEELLRDVLDGQVPLPAREYADLLVHRLAQLTNRLPEEIEGARRQLAAIADRQHHLAGAASVVRTWMEPRLDPPLGAEERGVQFVAETLGARPRLLAYQRFERSGAEILVGLCIHMETLYETFVAPRVRTAGHGDLILRPNELTPPSAAESWAQVLAMPLQAWQLQPASGFVDRVDREVRRQTWTYVGLTGLAVTVLMAALAALVTAVRREMALTRLKNEFVANVSHELKTPLALIRLFGETLLYGRAPSEEKRREYYSVITRESERLTHLINNILDFSRIDAGHKRYRRVACDLGQIVGQTIESYRFQLDHQGFDLGVEIEPDLPPVLADADAVSQALLNLLNNAVKYSADEKWVEVRVARASRDGRDGMTVSVADRGVGIPVEERDRLFEGFFRGSDNKVRQIRGSGLGLTLVRHIVTGHEGEVWVASEVGQGSTFTIFLPRAEARSPGET